MERLQEVVSIVEESVLGAKASLPQGRGLTSIHAAYPLFRLSRSAAFAAQTVIWRQGDTAVASNNFSLAAGWFALGTHPIFAELGDTTVPKLARKSALCWIRAGEREQVEETLKKGTGLAGKREHDAADEVVRFVSAITQDDEDGGQSLLPTVVLIGTHPDLGTWTTAARALNRMLSSPNFDPQMLLFAAKHAVDRGFKQLFHTILTRVLDVSQRGVQLDGVDTMILIRYARLTLTRDGYWTSDDQMFDTDAHCEVERPALSSASCWSPYTSLFANVRPAKRRSSLWVIISALVGALSEIKPAQAEASESSVEVPSASSGAATGWSERLDVALEDRRVWTNRSETK